MVATLVTSELIVLVIIAAIVSIALGFLVSNFGTKTKSEVITTYNNPSSSFAPIDAPLIINDALPIGNPCGIVRRL